MRKLTTVAAAAALAGLTMQAIPSMTEAQPEDRREWRGDRMPDERWDERDDFERRGRTDIECPLTQARREITNPLPEGWWNTPIVENLSGTEVQTIGGRRALVCRYGPAGQIMRLEPRRRTCTPTRRGFDCRRERFPNPGPFPPGGPGGPGGGVYSSGGFELRSSFQVDLETGRVGGPGADLWYHALTPTEAYLEPINGTRLSWGGGERRGFPGCRMAEYNTNRISLGRLNNGTMLCYRTGDGRIGELTVDGFGPQRSIRFSYTTWNGGDRDR